MSVSDEEKSQIKALLGRDPSQTESIIFETMWSEHCSYKSTKKELKRLPVTGKNVALGIGEDAGIVSFCQHEGVNYGIAVAHESHNHPSQVLPIEGAATGVGGVVRDVYCMGADVIGVLDSLHFGLNQDGQSPMVEEIADKVVQGVSEYGNALGVPVLGGETIYHESYNDNCLVNVAALGIIDTDQIIHSRVPKEAATEPYVLILIGKSTDATGFGGAAFSSKTLDEDDKNTNVGAVQVHDPFLKRVIVEATKTLFKKIKDEGISAGFKDLGAGGISCAGSELGISGGFGVEIDLDQVNVSIEGLAAEVIACSETQERYCLAVPEHFAETVLTIYNTDFELPTLYPEAGAAVIGRVIQEKQFKLKHKGKWVCDLPIAAITTDVSVKRESKPSKKVTLTSKEDKPLTTDIQKLALNILQDPNCVSKRYVYRFYDNAVRGATVVYPGEADAVVVTPVSGCDAAVAVSMDSNLYGHADPYVAGAAAVAESVRNIVAVGGTPLALTDCLNYGNPENPDCFYTFQQGVQGIADAANALSVESGEALPLISGNVSLYNESKNGTAVIPSPVILCVGKLDDYRKARTMQIFEPEMSLYMVAEPSPHFKGCVVARLGACTAEHPFRVDLQIEAKQNKFVRSVYEKEIIHACHDISMGGLWMTLIEMTLGERGLSCVGLEIELVSDPFTTLFAETGGYVLAIPKSQGKKLEKMGLTQGVTIQYLGQSTHQKKIRVQQQGKVLIEQDNQELSQQWNAANPY